MRLHPFASNPGRPCVTMANCRMKQWKDCVHCLAIIFNVIETRLWGMGCFSRISLFYFQSQFVSFNKLARNDISGKLCTIQTFLRSFLHAVQCLLWHLKGGCMTYQKHIYRLYSEVIPIQMKVLSGHNYHQKGNECHRGKIYLSRS